LINILANQKGRITASYLLLKFTNDVLICLKNTLTNFNMKRTIKYIEVCQYEFMEGINEQSVCGKRQDFQGILR
jgi:hypothetical protein